MSEVQSESLEEKKIWVGARKPIWADSSKTSISLMVDFEGLGEVDFTASPNDPMSYGAELFELASAGKFGEVSAYSAPELSAEMLTELVSQERDRRLADAALRIAPLEDAVELGEATASEVSSLSAWRSYRVRLSRVDQQPGFPKSVVWPESP
jgi:hypothetical protein